MTDYINRNYHHRDVILCNEKPNKLATKTGRKFILKNGVPVLVENK